mgnify:CR=1 FL=1
MWNIYFYGKEIKLASLIAFRPSLWKMESFIIFDFTKPRYQIYVKKTNFWTPFWSHLQEQNDLLLPIRTTI